VELAARAWAEGTLLGGISLVPGGTGVTGSAAILVLVAGGVPEALATASLAVVRAGTLWYAVALGFLVLWRFRAPIRALVRAAPGPSHFDAIAERYEHQIPAHTRERFVERKLELMLRRLEAAGIARGARGLDVGCGPGWYASSLAATGFPMLGVDLSVRQLAHARAGTRTAGAPVAWVVADAAALPVADASVDFAYAVNAMHHVADPGARDRLLREAVRVLRPGGVFCLHEMNTRNPLFGFYLAYVYPLIKEIDEGDEVWIRCDALPPLAGARWEARVDTFTFLPDALPRRLEQALLPVERWLERSPLGRYGAHFLAVLRKDPGPAPVEAPPPRTRPPG
jgi:ubiquinone/menaquinone biosynthesis C-methylase UbiE